MAKKLSTEEILKAARAQTGKSGGPSETPPADAPAASAPPEEVMGSPASPAAAKPAGTPKSTKDILAAARAQGTSGTGAPPAAKAAAATPPAAAASPLGAAPKSTKDILAAARAQTQASGAPAAGAKQTADKPAVSKAASPKVPVVTAKPPGNRPSVQEMLKAAREGRSAEVPAAGQAATAAAVAVKPAAAALVIPQKPAPAAKKTEPEAETRRGFLASMWASWVAIWWFLFGTPFRAAWTTFTAASGLWGLETARFMMPNVLVEPPSKFKVGPTSDYPPASVSTKWTAQYGVWLVHNEYRGKDVIYALLTVCTHLGCTPNWLEGERKFKCPCHGSGFYITGVNFEGPAPRPLERMAIHIAEDGAIEVDKSRKFQEELGQWADPASFVPVA